MPVPEAEVQTAVALWLVQEGWTIKAVSVAKGPGINYRRALHRLQNALLTAGVAQRSYRVLGDGPDIVASKAGEIWRIECKGSGVGMPLDRRANFDRGVASAVSYFAEGRTALRLGLALVDDAGYRRLRRLRLGDPLLTRLGLYVFWCGAAVPRLRASGTTVSGTTREPYLSARVVQVEGPSRNASTPASDGAHPGGRPGVVDIPGAGASFSEAEGFITETLRVEPSEVAGLAS